MNSKRSKYNHILYSNSWWAGCSKFLFVVKGLLVFLKSSNLIFVKVLILCILVKSLNIIHVNFTFLWHALIMHFINVAKRYCIYHINVHLFTNPKCTMYQKCNKFGAPHICLSTRYSKEQCLNNNRFRFKWFEFYFVWMFQNFHYPKHY